MLDEIRFKLFKIKHKLCDHIKGATTLEYILLAALVIVFLVGAWALISSALDDKVSDIVTQINSGYSGP